MRASSFILLFIMISFGSCKSETPVSQVQSEDQISAPKSDSVKELPADNEQVDVVKPSIEDIPEVSKNTYETPVDDPVESIKEPSDLSDNGNSNDKQDPVLENTDTSVWTTEDDIKLEEQEEENLLPDNKPEVENEVIPVDIHDPWDKLLKEYVSSTGRVNYAGLKKVESSLDAYLETLNKSGIKEGWSRNQKMAFWINAYNAFTVKLILKNYPVSSIMNISGGKAWDVSWIKIAGETYSLNDIEHKILRPKYKDARIHFAVNCAAKSCPALYNGAWTAANIEGLLESQTKKFINNGDFNNIESNKLVLSKIFEWYKEDFGSLQNYISKYVSTPVQASAKVNFMEYDWSLNQ